MTASEFPLENKLFEIKNFGVPESEGIMVEKRFAHNSATFKRDMMELKDKLDTIGLITYTPIDASGEPLDREDFEKAVGVRVSGRQNMTWLKEHGAVFFAPDVLKGYTFNKARHDQLTIVPRSQDDELEELKQILNLLGIKPEPGSNGSITINGKTSLCEVALSGGSFSQSAEYLAQHQGMFR